MFGMYSIAGCRFEQPAASSSAAASRAPEAASARRRAAWDRSLRTDHPHVGRPRLLEELERPALVPPRSDVGEEERESVVRERAVEDRRAEVRQAARDQERGEGHRAADQDSSLERDRDE